MKKLVNPPTTGINFKNIKEKKQTLDLSSNNEELYNRDISKMEMMMALKSAEDTTPGPDNASYDMLLHLPERAIDYLLNIFNELYKANYFPKQW